MAVRHRALARLHRHVPHVTAVDARALPARLVDREAEDLSTAVMAGESVHVRAEVHERSLRGPNAGPNAPLLIRLVRYPYGMRPVRFGRRAGTERPDPGSARPGVSVETARDLLEESRIEFMPSPTERVIAEAPPRPFQRRRDEADLDDTVPVGVE